MKKLFYLAVLCFISWAACKKTTTSPPVKSPFSFEVSGVKDLFVETNGADSMTLNIERTLGTSQKVTLSIEGLPQGVTAVFNPNNGLPPFTPTVKLIAKDAVEGSYTVTLKASNDVAGEQTHEFLLKVSKPVPDCIPSLLGSYTGSELCESTTVPAYIATVERVENKENSILITNFGNLKVNIEVRVNCSANRLTIPQQTVDNTTVIGTGSIVGNRLKINYTVTVQSGAFTYSSTCDADYLKQ